MKVLDLFSGIGGFSLGLERAGMETVAFCEIEPYPQAVLRKNFPGVPIYDDVRTVTAERLRADGINTVDLVCGGFPCQPFSVAGKRKGKDDDRFLWPEMLRIVSESRPRWVIGENVAGFVDMAIEEMWADLDNIGYTVQPFIIPACAVGADHRRDRVWIVANSNSVRPERGEQGVPEAFAQGHDTPDMFATELFGGGFGNDIPSPRIFRAVDGLSNGVDRVKCLGNTVVPQIPEIIGRAIMATEKANCPPPSRPKPAAFSYSPAK